MDNQPNILAVCYRFDSGGSETLASLIIQDLLDKEYNISCAATNSLHGPMRERLEKSGIDCYGLDFDNKNKLSRFWYIFSLLKNLKIDILYIQHFTMFTHFYWPAKLLGIKKIIVTEHTDQPYHNGNALVKLVKRKIKQVSAVTVVHKNLAQFFHETFDYPREKIHVIVNGVNVDKFKPDAKPYERKIFNINDNEFIFGCVARLNELKDHNNLLQAIVILKEKYQKHNFKVLLIGDGELYEELHRFCIAKNLNEDVIFLKDRNDVDLITPIFDTFVLSSKSEGLPIVLLEAMACGVPCISTDVGGIAGLLEDTGGELVPPENAEALAEALNEYLNKPKKELKLIGEQARIKIIQSYNHTAMLKAYENIIAKN